VVTPLISFEVSSESQLCKVAYSQVMELWHHGNFMKCFLPLTLRMFLDIQITFPRTGGIIVQNLMVVSLAITHIVKFLKYASKINVIHEDTLIRLFLVSLEAGQKSWVKNCCSPKSISSLTFLIDEFLRQ